MGTQQDRRAVGLYAVLARDVGDFIEMVSIEYDVEVLVTLFRMLSLPGDPKKTDNELNKIGASIVRGVLLRVKTLDEVDAIIADLFADRDRVLRAEQAEREQGAGI
jgi:hypothetical protein